MKRVMMWVNLVVGLWLSVSPLVLTYQSASTSSTAAILNQVILGTVLIATSGWILATQSGQLGVSWVQVVCGLWLIVAPFFLRTGELPLVLNSLISGAVVLVAGGFETWTLTPRHRQAA
jgi:SPW repeat